MYKQDILTTKSYKAIRQIIRENQNKHRATRLISYTKDQNTGIEHIVDIIEWTGMLTSRNNFPIAVDSWLLDNIKTDTIVKIVIEYVPFEL